jgi:tetratricopeptide (TPR) repeat protein
VRRQTSALHKPFHLARFTSRYSMSDHLKRLLPLLLENKSLNESGIRMLQKVHADIKRKPKGRTDEEWFVLGYYALQVGQHDEAVTSFSEAIFENEEFEAAFRFRATAYMESKRFAEAAKDLDEALRIDPTYTDAQYERIRLLYEMDKDKEATLAAREFTQANPEHANAFALLGSILEKSGNYVESIPAFDQAISLEDDNGLFFTQRGLAHYFGGFPELALNDLLKAQSLTGANQVTHFNLALIYGELPGQTREAFRYFERAFKKDPNMLKQFANSANPTEAKRLVGKLHGIVTRLASETDPAGRFYRDELTALLQRKLSETTRTI